MDKGFFCDKMVIKQLLPVGAYIISAALMVFYLSVLWASATPRVNLAYRLYYIEKELDTWPGMTGFDYEIGTPVYMDQAQARCGKGWERRNGQGSLPTDEGGMVYFDGLPEGDLQMTVTCDATQEGETLSAEVNGMKVLLDMRAEDQGNQVWTASVTSDDGELQLLIKSTGDTLVKEIRIE